jgi:hypothetical protein
MSLFDSLEHVMTGVIFDEISPLEIEPHLIKAIKKKYGFNEDIYFAINGALYGSGLLCTTDKAYEYENICASTLERYLRIFQQGNGAIEFLDTGIVYTNLEDLLKDILTIKLSQI